MERIKHRQQCCLQAGLQQPGFIKLLEPGDRSKTYLSFREQTCTSFRGLCYLYMKTAAQIRQHYILQQSVIHHDIFQEKFRNTKFSEKSHVAFLNQTWRQKKTLIIFIQKKINFFYRSIIFPILLKYIFEIV